MILNGWQRLWILVSALWIIPVIVIAWASWPTVAQIADAEVHRRMNPANLAKLTPPSMFLGYDKEGVEVWGTTRESVVSQWGPPIAVRPDGQATSFSKWIIGSSLDLIVVEGRTLHFIPMRTTQTGLGYDRELVAKDFETSLHAALRANRAVWAGWMLALWAVPAFAVHGLGWAVAWVRRGFARRSTPAA